MKQLLGMFSLLQSGHDVRGIQCAEDYSGPFPLSEPETQHIVNYFRENAPIIGVIDWHSYGELILRPWGTLSNRCKSHKSDSSL